MIVKFKYYVLLCVLGALSPVLAQEGREERSNSADRQVEATAASATQQQSRQEPQKESPQEIQEEPKQNVKQEVAEEAQPEPQSGISDSTVKPRIPPAKPPVDRSGSFIGSTSIPPMPALKPVAASNKHQDDKDADFEPGEILLASADMQTAMATARQLRAYGLRLKSRQQLAQLALVVTLFRVPAGENTKALLTRIQKQFPDLIVDTNQRYRLLASKRRTWAQDMLVWPEAQNACLVGRDLRIGLVDTAVNQQHPALEGSTVVVEDFVNGQQAPALHGTALASLFVGNTKNGYTGLLPDGQLFAASVFRQREGQEDSSDTVADTNTDNNTDTTTSALLHALEWLSAQRVQVINLSLGGRRNRLFELALERVMAMNITVVAAAGNQGPTAEPVYPAAQEGVIAVTAVDAAGQIYSEANRGDYIDFAAPGVDIWAANGEGGGQYHTGTSFAAPFITALLVIETELERVKSTVEDRGAEGKDPVFGWGLVKGPKKCRLQSRQRS